MKKTLLLFVAVAMTALSAMAQDINQATESYNNGAMELQMGNSAAALEYFKSALTMGEALGDEGSELVANCMKAISNTTLSMAKDLYNARDFAGAAAAFQQAKETAEGYGEAEIAAEAAELIGQANLNLFNQAGKDALRAKDFATAITNFTKVLELDPTNGTAALQLGQAYMSSGKTEDAIKYMNVALENGQEKNAKNILSKIYVRLAQSNLKTKNYEEVITLAAKSNEYDENGNAYRLAASAAQKLGRNDECISLYEKYLEVSPNAKDASGVICTIAVLYQQAGNKEKAKEYYQKIVTDPQYGITAQEQLKALN